MQSIDNLYKLKEYMRFRYIGRLKSLKDLNVAEIKLKREERGDFNIAVIDDETFPLMDLLKSHRFVIDKFDDINSIKQLEAYDIILCDIQGVGVSFSNKYQGAYLIKEIYKSYPFKIIIAYTGSNYDPRYNEYLKFAEYNIAKDSDSENWVDILDEAIKQLSMVEYRWIRIRKFLLKKGVSLLDLALLEDDFVTRALEHKSFEDFPSKKIRKGFSNDEIEILSLFVKTVSKIFI